MSLREDHGGIMCLRQWLPVEGHLPLLHRVGAGHWRCWGQALPEICAPVTWAVSDPAKSFRDKQGLSGVSGSLSLYRMHSSIHFGRGWGRKPLTPCLPASHVEEPTSGAAVPPRCLA